MDEFRFNYKTLEEISEDCSRRELRMGFSENIDILYEPIEVGGRTLGNRLAILPMEGSDSTPDGKPGELTFRRWKRFGAGGAKMIWGEATAVVKEGRSNPKQLLLNEENIPEFKELVRQTRQAHREKFGTDEDLLVGLQLNHAGRQSFEKPLIAFRSPVHDPLSFLDKRAQTPLPEDYPIVTDDYLENLEDRFLDAARGARDAGFDFVDIKQCHGYLLNELLAARTRGGKYGDSFRNRRRFVRNVIKKIMGTLGSDIFVASRLNVYDGVPFVRDSETGVGKPVEFKKPYLWGWGVDKGNPLREDLTEPKRLVDILAGAGVGLLGVSAGIPYYSPHLVRPFNKPTDGGYLSPEHPLLGVERLFKLTTEIQYAFQELPVVGSGYSWLREYMLQAGALNVALRKVSVVGMGRSAFAYPDFAMDGKESVTLSSKKICLGDSMCSNMLKGWDDQGEKSATGCAIRDSEYKEVYKNLKKSGKN